MLVNVEHSCNTAGRSRLGLEGGGVPCLRCVLNLSSMVFVARDDSPARKPVPCRENTTAICLFSDLGVWGVA